MSFAADKYRAKFGGIQLFVEEYTFSRSAVIRETALLNGNVDFRNGGEKAARIILTGKAESPCAHLLDKLVSSGEVITLTYGGMVFMDTVLVSFSCKGKSGSSENVTVEFVSTGQITETVVTE